MKTHTKVQIKSEKFFFFKQHPQYKLKVLISMYNIMSLNCLEINFTIICDIHDTVTDMINDSYQHNIEDYHFVSTQCLDTTYVHE
jgi:hypothetical protein